MKHVIRAVGLALALTTLFCTGAAAERANSLKDGAWALQFSVEGEFIRVGGL